MNTEGIKKWKADAIVLNKDANQTVQQSVFKSSDVEGKFKEEAPLKQIGVIASNERVKRMHYFWRNIKLILDSKD